ncbi:MAG: hypothetical protein M1269_01675 [Chloroflexi bacterium]|nr:hypothetical protein [Chloroflexota bacterium]
MSDTHTKEIRDRIKQMDETHAAESEGFMDIRYFIGLMLLIYGVIISFTGLLTQFGKYALPEALVNDLNRYGINFNLNLWWGLLILLIGIIFYCVSRKPKEWAK